MENKKLNMFVKNKEAKNAAWIIGGRITRIAISFFIGVITTRYLGPENFGTLNYTHAYVLFFNALCSLGIESIIIKDFMDHPDEIGLALGTTLVLRELSSLFSALVIIGLIYFLDGVSGNTLLVAALSCIALLFQVENAFDKWFQANYQSKVSSVAEIVAYICVALYRIILMLNGKSVAWFAFASSVDYIALAIVKIIAYKKYNGPRLTFSMAKAKQLLGISYHYILSGMMIAIYGQTDKMMLKHMLDETSVGFYSLATNLNGLWVFVLTAIISSMYPTIVALNNKDRTAFERKNRQLYAIVSYCSIAVALGFQFFGKFGIRLLYGEAFVDAATPLKIVCWYTMFSYLGVAREAWVVCTNNQKYLKYIGGVAAIANVFMNLLLIPKWGASGAAAASLITQIMTSMVIPAFIPSMRPNVKLMVDALLLKDFRKNVLK